jgi:hypothetical protein
VHRRGRRVSARRTRRWRPWERERSDERSENQCLVERSEK